MATIDEAQTRMLGYASPQRRPGIWWSMTLWGWYGSIMGIGFALIGAAGLAAVGYASGWMPDFQPPREILLIGIAMTGLGAMMLISGVLCLRKRGPRP